MLDLDPRDVPLQLITDLRDDGMDGVIMRFDVGRLTAGELLGGFRSAVCAAALQFCQPGAVILAKF
ncbi:MAG: hypothetical protein IPM16_15595 [Chloroflexi bacterium]|nr:hypothetical protein [Chloroflexota bacterium]